MQYFLIRGLPHSIRKTRRKRKVMMQRKDNFESLQQLAEKRLMDQLEQLLKSRSPKVPAGTCSGMGKIARRYAPHQPGKGADLRNPDRRTRRVSVVRLETAWREIRRKIIQPRECSALHETALLREHGD
jgi:hypothetical protein